MSENTAYLAMPEHKLNELLQVVDLVDAVYGEDEFVGYEEEELCLSWRIEYWLRSLFRRKSEGGFAPDVSIPHFPILDLEDEDDKPTIMIGRNTLKSVDDKNIMIGSYSGGSVGVVQTKNPLIGAYNTHIASGYSTVKFPDYTGPIEEIGGVPVNRASNLPDKTWLPVAKRDLKEGTKFYSEVQRHVQNIKSNNAGAEGEYHFYFMNDEFKIHYDEDGTYDVYHLYRRHPLIDIS